MSHHIPPHGPAGPAYGPPYGPATGPVFINVPRPFNHGLHLVLDAVSCGLWIPVHVLLRILHKG